MVTRWPADELFEEAHCEDQDQGRGDFRLQCVEALGRQRRGEVEVANAEFPHAQADLEQHRADQDRVDALEEQDQAFLAGAGTDRPDEQDRLAMTA